MGPIIALLLIAGVSLLVVRVGAAALVLTGMSADAASFQATSAYFGVGFTTSETEMVVNHPVRRRIVRDLIVAGNIGVISALTAGTSAFLSEHEGEFVHHGLVLAGGALSLLVLARFGAVRLLDPLIRRALERAGVVRAMDYELVLRAGHGFAIAQVEIEPGHWLTGRGLAETRLGKRGVIVLGLTRSDGSYLGTPGASTRFAEGDVLTVYGREVVLERLREPREALPPEGSAPPEDAGAAR